jgi:zinc transport system permease protein
MSQLPDSGAEDDVVFASVVTWLVEAIRQWAPEDTILSHPFAVRALLAVILVSLVCGAIGSLVIGKRMAFFSDALAHCAFAGVALGTLLALIGEAELGSNLHELGVPVVMVLFGLAVGLSIAYVRERTGLANDTVIGVFFAGAIGFGAMLFKSLSQFRYFNLDAFLFGAPETAHEDDLVVLIVLALLVFVLLGFMYNQLVFASFNASLARSRNVKVQLCNYLFIAILALIVNLSIRTVGALLINALLIVPAATAAIVARNLRQMFWMSLLLSLAAGVGGLILSLEIQIPMGRRGELSFGSGGVIVVLSVLLFFLAMALAPRLQRRTAA